MLILWIIWAVFIGASMALFVVGLLWAPFVGIISGRVARKRNAIGDWYGVAGTGYSALFLLPWIYLMFRLYDKNIFVSLILLVYVWVYLIWLALIAGYVGFLYTEVFTSRHYAIELHGLVPVMANHIMWLAVVSLNIFMWIFSLYRLLRVHRLDRARLGDAPREVLPGGAYIHPFGYFMVSILVFPVIWLISWGAAPQ